MEFFKFYQVGDVVHDFLNNIMINVTKYKVFFIASSACFAARKSIHFSCREFLFMFMLY